MITEMFNDDPEFPFAKYYCNVDDYSKAQRYWLSLLRAVSHFNEGEWAPVIRPIDVRDDMNTGFMFWLRNTRDRKEVIIYTNGFEGSVNLYMTDNAGYTEEEIKGFERDFGYFPPEAEKRGLRWKEAEKDVRLMYENFNAGVENRLYFHHDPSHSDGGVEIPIERLILNSEISERTEPLAVQALELFLQEGPAMQRVHRIFSPDPEP